MQNQNPYDMAHELARAIKNSEIYRRYVMAEQQLEQNPQEAAKVRQFRIRQMEVNKAELLGQDPGHDNITELTLEYAKLNTNKMVESYFNAEGAFVQMFTDIQQIIQKSIESGFDN